VRTRWIRCSAGLAGLLAAASLLVPSENSRAADPLPPGQTKKLIDADVAYLKKGLAKKPDKPVVNTLHGVAMLLALEAQNTGESGLRDQALKVAEALSKSDFAAAKAAADGLSNPPGGADILVKLHEKAGVDVNVIMGPMRNAPRGLNIEKDLKAQSKKVTDVKLVADVAARSALIAEYTALLPSTEATGAKKKIWDDSTDDMKKLSKEIVVEAAKGDKADKAALQKKLAALDASCTACHNTFK
jgi:hypothetical protein